MFPRVLLIVSLLYCMGLFYFSDWSRALPGISTGSPKRMLFVFPFAFAWLAALELDRMRERRPTASGIRIECELEDEDGELGGLLVLIPDAPSLEATCQESA